METVAAQFLRCEGDAGGGALESNCSDCTPELDNVVIEALRTISI